MNNSEVIYVRVTRKLKKKVEADAKSQRKKTGPFVRDLLESYLVTAH